MVKYVYLLTLFFLVSCTPTSKESGKHQAPPTPTLSTTEALIENNTKLTDKTVKFVWREDQYDAENQDTLNVLFINEDFCKTITDPERAALGYVATFIGNECWWDGEPKDDRSNLKCKILTALNLGYQCSNKHLGFLRQWFKNDKKSLEELENCPTTPYTASIQDTFDEISLTVKGSKISVFFKVAGINTQAGDSWTRTETDHFQWDGDHIKLIKKDASKVEHDHVEADE